MAKATISIELNEKENAIIYFEKTLGGNITIRKRASVIFYASKGVNTITELHRKCGCTRVFVRSTLRGYAEKGIDYRASLKSHYKSRKNPPNSLIWKLADCFCKKGVK